MNDAQQDKKWTNFYFRLRKQYQQGRPITYELDLNSNQPKPRAGKFMIIISKLMNIFKYGMRQTYDNEDDRRDNYWSQLNKHFHDDYQMGYVNESYWDKPKNKLKKYVALLIHTKRIFTVFEEIVKDMIYLYQDQEKKKQNFRQQMKNLQFMADGQYKVMGEQIARYQQYADARREKQKVKELERIAELKKKQQEQKQKKLKQEQEQRKKEQLLRKQKQQQQIRKKIEQKMKQEAEKKIKQEEQGRIITSQYFPSDYKAAFNNIDKKPFKKDPSRGNLQLPNNQNYNEKIKNSQRLFRERFKDQLQVFAYALKPEMSQQKTLCFSCKENLKSGVYLLGGNQNFCYYTGKWYCNNCIADERMSIPWKAIQSFDLRGYSVSKVAYAQLKTYYQKPIIEITRQNPIISQNKKFHQFLVVKRQVHLIYDAICNLQIIQALIKKKQNYCLKINLFSMKNLYDIYNGQQTIKLQRDYQFLSKHFYRCDICQNKKGFNCPVCKDPVKIFPFEIKDVVACKQCRKLYHRKCVPSGVCKCKEDD